MALALRKMDTPERTERNGATAELCDALRRMKVGQGVELPTTSATAMRTAVWYAQMLLGNKYATAMTGDVLRIVRVS